jgi:AcrR family transcriptional regulator
MIKRRLARPQRRSPSQERARQTVEAVLDAVLRIVKRDGVDSMTTNRIAEVAGVSVGSLYQYFPDKHAIYAALHDRHIAEIDRTIGRTLVQHAESDLKSTLCALLNALIDAHVDDREGLAFLMTEVPHRSANSKQFAERISGALRLILSSRGNGLHKAQLNGMVFVLANMFEALSHGAALQRPSTLSLDEAREHGARAIRAYIDASVA